MIGIIAAVLTTVSFIPQVIQVVRTKDTSSISLFMYVLFVVGVMGWIIHGIIMQDNAIIFANVFTFIFSSYILFVKIQNTLKQAKEKIPEM